MRPVHPHRTRRVLTPLVLPATLLAMLLAMLLAVPTASASAQLINAIKRKAAQAIEKRAGEKLGARADSMEGDSVATSDDGAPPKRGAEKGAMSRGALTGLGMLPNAPTESSYTFDVIASYELTSTEKGKAEPPMQMTLHFNRTQPYFGTKMTETSGKRDQQEIFAIFDGKNESMVMLMSDGDGKMSMANRWKNAAESMRDTVMAANAATVEAIGTRTILGFSATGYRITDGDAVSEVWLTTEVAMRFGAIMSASSSVKKSKAAIPSNIPDGMLLESTTKNARDRTEIVMRATAVDTKANVTINMVDYPRMGGPGL